IRTAWKAILRGNELLQGMTRHRHNARPTAGGQRHLAYINRHAMVDPDRMRREEVAGRTGIVAAAPACQQVAVGVEDADESAGRSGRRRTRAGPAARAEAQLGHEKAVLAIDEYLARPGHLGPLAQIIAGG